MNIGDQSQKAHHESFLLKIKLRSPARPIPGLFWYCAKVSERPGVIRQVGGTTCKTWIWSDRLCECACVQKVLVCVGAEGAWVCVHLSLHHKQHKIRKCISTKSKGRCRCKGFITRPTIKPITSYVAVPLLLYTCKAQLIKQRTQLLVKCSQYCNFQLTQVYM